MEATDIEGVNVHLTLAMSSSPNHRQTEMKSIVISGNNTKPLGMDCDRDTDISVSYHFVFLVQESSRVASSVT